MIITDMSSVETANKILARGLFFRNPSWITPFFGLPSMFLEFESKPFSSSPSIVSKDYKCIAYLSTPKLLEVP